VKISVVICTWNRAASLARTLESIARCAPPARAAWQVVVVDNNSTDGTTAAIAAFRGRLPLTAVFEPKQGVSHARNAGVDAADGDYFLWTDDDVTVGATWLRSYETSFERHPGAALFGGAIRPRFEGTPPGWLPSILPVVMSAYAGLDLSADEITLGANLYALPYGANMAIRGREQRAFRYDPSLGRQPGTLMVNGEESDLLRRIVKAGGSGVWLPAAPVEHWILPERQSPRYLRRYYAGLGYVLARTAIIEGQGTSARRKIMSRARIVWHDGVYGVGRLLGRPLVWANALKKAARLRGALVAQRAAASQPPLGIATR